MVNFKPMHDQMIWLIDKSIKEKGIQGPFLDIGGGIGDVSLHLAKKGFKGKLVDFSKSAIEHAKKNLSGTAVKIQHKDILKVKEKFNLILILDVLEHLPNDKKIIRHIYNILNEGGYIFVSVPIRMKEFTWLDNYYGHLRRYEVKELVNLLSNEKFEIKGVWDYSFPFFWIMRKIYTKLYTHKKMAILDTTKKTKASGWRNYTYFNKYLRFKILWYPVWKINHIFRNRYLGIQVLVLAHKKLKG